MFTVVVKEQCNDFSIPIHFYNQNILLWCLVNGFLDLLVEVVDSTAIMSRCRCIKLVRTIEQLSDKVTSAVQMNGSMREWFKTKVGVRQGCPLSSTLFSIFLERIMSDPLEEHDRKVNIGGRNITNLRFVDHIDALAEEEQEPEAVVESLDKTCTRCKMVISAEKTKLMTNTANGIQREMNVKRQKLGIKTSSKYLGAVVSDDGSEPEILSRTAQATAALTKLKTI